MTAVECSRKIGAYERQVSAGVLESAPLTGKNSSVGLRITCTTQFNAKQPTTRAIVTRYILLRDRGDLAMSAAHAEVTQLEIDQRVLDLYDEYCHGGIDRREFLSRSAALCAAGLVMAQALLPRYARAQTISFTDEHIQAKYVTYPSHGGNSGTMRGYLVQPASKTAGNGPFPAVLVVHENRGLNPYVEDVARRAAVAGFLALAPDGLFPAGGYPGNDDDGRTLQAGLDQAKLRTDMLNSARYLKGQKISNGKLGVTGFCWGGGTSNYLAATMGPDLQASAPFYGAAAETAAVAKIRAALLIHYAENDPRINEMWPGY